MTTAPHSGPPGYEQQYRVTAWLALLFDAPSLRVYVEQQAEEDFTLCVNTGGADRTIEVQVKSSTDSLSVRDFMEILAKFPARASTNCFLERLRSDGEAIGVIVVGGRALDEINPFVILPTHISATPRPTSPLNPTAAKTLLESLGELYAKRKSDLSKQRHAHCKSLAQTIKPADFCDLARRIFVIERVDADDTICAIATLLETRYRVPGAIAPRVADPVLRKQVELGRTHGNDIMPALRQTIEEHGVDRVAPRQPYLIRGDEDALAVQLDRDRLLLLTGLPWCGKTQLALAVAERFQRQGYHVAQFSSTADAERFLLDPASGERRLAILDDPFGRNEIGAEASEAWGRLESLVPLRQHRALLVTSRVDILQTLHRTQDRALWRLDAVRWVEVLMHEDGFGMKVWRAWAQQGGHDIATIERVASLLDTSSNQLGPGHFRHLATQETAFLREAQANDLVEYARRDAAQIGHELCRKAGVRDVLRVLALTASTLSGPRKADLDHLLGIETESPGRRIGRRDVFPSYDQSSHVSQSQRDILDELESRGMVAWMGDRLVLTHPCWERAAAFSLTSAGSFARQDLDKLGRRAILCLDSDCAVQALDVLGRLRARAGVGDVEREALASTMFVAFDSIFPRVSMQAVISILMATELDTLPETQQERIFGELSIPLPSADSLKWEDGRAWVAGDSSELFWVYPEFDSPTQMVTLEDALTPDTVLRMLSEPESEGQVNRNMLEAALSSPEAVLRAKAGYVAAKHHITNPDGEALIRRALNDDHPWVVVETIVGLALSWSSLGPTIRAELKSMLEQTLRKPAFALVAMNRFNLFRQLAGYNTDWYHGHSTPWDLWASCTAAALPHYPARRQLDEVKLYDLGREACKRLPLAEGLALVEAWLTWVERRVNFMIPSAYGGSIAEVLLIATESDTLARVGLFPRLLNQQDTGLQGMILRDLMKGWEKLGDTERQAIIILLHTIRSDRRWLQAITMVAGNPPPEVQMAITGHAEALAMAPEVVVQTWPTQLLDDCISVFTGHPQPLLCIGTFHENREFWEPVIVYLAHGESASASLSLREIISCYSTELYYTCWRGLCDSASGPRANEMFEKLLFWTVKHMAAAALEPYWQTLMLSPAAKDLRAQWAASAARVIEGIDYSDNLKLLVHLPEVFDDGMPADKLMLGLLSAFDRQKVNEVREILVQTYDEITIASVRTTWSLERLKHIAGSEMSDAQLRAVEKRRLELIELGSAQVDALDDHYELPHWVQLWRRS